MAEDCKKFGDENCDGVACSDCVWSFLAGDAGYQSPAAIAFDASGNLFVTGNFGGTLKLLNSAANSHVTLNSSGTNDIFLAKFSPQGDVIWAKSFGSNTNSGLAQAIAVTTIGDVLISGGVSGQADFGSGVLPASTLGGDVFVAKFSAAGAPQWSKRFGSATGASYQYNSANAMAIDSNGDIAIGGTISGPITFGNVNVSQPAGQDMFVTKLVGGTGTVSWAKRFMEQSGTANVDQQLAQLAIDSSNNIFLVGSFSGSVVFAPTQLSTGGSQNSAGFVAKLDATGSPSWAKSFGPTTAGTDTATTLADLPPIRWTVSL